MKLQPERHTQLHTPRDKQIMSKLLKALVAGSLIGMATELIVPAVGTEVDTAAIASEGSDGQWLSYGRNYSEQRFSPLAQVTKDNVGRLGLEWFLDLPNARSLEATPLAVDGILYFTTSWSVVYAVDGATGRVLWVFDPESRQVMSTTPERLKTAWGTHRGVAFWKGKVYLGTSDGRLIALGAKTGKPIWSVQTFDPDSPRTITSAPRVFGGKVIIGHAGGDIGSIRGYVTAYDDETGKQAWRFYTVPGNPAEGFENEAMAAAAKTWTGDWWKFGGGGAVWNAITYDPAFNRIYIGTGNGQPWNRKMRSEAGGDNLFTASIVALDADTGRYVWHYQVVPGDTWDFDAATDMVLADLLIDGSPKKVLMQASKNGFFYVIDRSNGKLVSAAAFGHQTWADHIDLATGRPVEVAGMRYEKGEALLWPGAAGAHSWQPMSYSPLTGLVYIPSLDVPFYYNDSGLKSASWRPEKFSMSSGLNARDGDVPANAGKAALIAWDPLKQQSAWRVDFPGAWPAGTMVTQGHLVFSGNAAGHFAAFADDTGKKLWDFDAGRGIVAPPITYMVDGKQLISVLVDWSGSVNFGGSLFAQHGWTYRGPGRRLLTFALDGKAVVPAAMSSPEEPMDVPSFTIDPAKEAVGNQLYAGKCGMCHGADVRSGGGAPDLRASPVAADLDALKTVVLKGALSKFGMGAFPELNDDDVEAIYAHIRARARATRLEEKR
jgi:quinohemoprotein ethanol dehydrogenase